MLINQKTRPAEQPPAPCAQNPQKQPQKPSKPTPKNKKTTHPKPPKNQPKNHQKPNTESPPTSAEKAICKGVSLFSPVENYFLFSFFFPLILHLLFPLNGKIFPLCGKKKGGGISPLRGGKKEKEINII